MKKAQVTLWNHDTNQNEVTEATFLHWGISHQELNNGIGHYTVAFVMLSDGTVKEVYPTNIKFEVDERFEFDAVLLPVDEKRQKLEKAAPDLLDALNSLIGDINADGYNYRLATMNKVEQAIKQATE